MGYLLTTQRQFQKIRDTLTAVDTGGVATVTNRTNAYFFDNLVDDSLQLSGLANGVMIKVSLAAEDDTVIIQLWGHPQKGDLELLGTITGVAGTQTDTNGGVYVEDWTTVDDGTVALTESTAVANTVSIISLDPRGIEHIYPYVTTASADISVQIYARSY